MFWIRGLRFLCLDEGSIGEYIGTYRYIRIYIGIIGIHLDVYVQRKMYKHVAFRGLSVWGFWGQVVISRAFVS